MNTSYQKTIHWKKGRPSPIGGGGNPPLSGNNVLTCSNDSGPFGVGGNDPPRGGDNKPPREYPP
jgi:hypothetical protein